MVPLSYVMMIFYMHRLVCLQLWMQCCCLQPVTHVPRISVLYPSVECRVWYSSIQHTIHSTSRGTVLTLGNHFLSTINMHKFLTFKRTNWIVYGTKVVCMDYTLIIMPALCATFNCFGSVYNTMLCTWTRYVFCVMHYRIESCVIFRILLRESIYIVWFMAHRTNSLAYRVRQKKVGP